MLGVDRSGLVRQLVADALLREFTHEVGQCRLEIAVHVLALHDLGTGLHGRHFLVQVGRHWRQAVRKVEFQR